MLLLALPTKRKQMMVISALKTLKVVAANTYKTSLPNFLLKEQV